MSSVGPNNPSSFTQVSGSGDIDFTWDFLTNAGSSDNAYASVTLSQSDVSEILVATNFGFSIPTGQQIDGILVEVERKASSMLVIQDSTVKLFSGGSPISASKASSSKWTTTDTYASYGAAADKWSATLTPAAVNSSTFGVGVGIYSNSGLSQTAYIDHIRMTIYYSTPAAPPPNTGFLQFF